MANNQEANEPARGSPTAPSSSVPAQDVSATQGAAREPVAAEAGETFLPAFPQSVVQLETFTGGVVPSPLKPDSSFRGIATLVSDKRPLLREVRSARPDAPEQAPLTLHDEVPAPVTPNGEDAAVIDDTPRIAGMALPSRGPKTSRGRRIWFAVSFMLPVILGALYMFLIAPDEYVTEFRFSVRLPIPESTTPMVQNKSFLFDGNTTPGTDLIDNYTVVDYVASRQAALDLNAKLNLRDMFNRPFDPLSKVGANASAERLARFWHGMVYSSYDPASGLAVVRIKAYSAQDSYAIATNLVNQSSELVNSIGAHSQRDSVRFAQQQLDRATAQVAALNVQIADFRRRTGMLNPDEGVTGPVNGAQGLITQLKQRQNQLHGQIDQVMAQLHNPDSPQVVLLRQQQAANDQQLAAAKGALGLKGVNNLANTVTEFEAAENKLHDWQGVLHQSISTLAAAQAASDAQRVYMTTYVKPSLPESPLAPNRWLDLLIITMAAAMIWAIGRLVENSILEHG